jgi:GWxTD domain-containing protein
MTFRRLTTLLLTLAPAVAVVPAWAGLDKDAKKWLDGVAPIILPDEQKVFESLKDKSDQAEFEQIFWARRDPDLSTPENEFEVEYGKLKAEADQKFKVFNNEGADTDCGRLYILLGAPAEVKGIVAENADQRRQQLAEGGRNPETWIYKGPRFAGGEAAISFDSACMGPKTDAFRKQLDRFAAARVVHPNVDYRFDKDSHLVKLADLLPKPSPALSLLEAPRQDFALTTQSSFLKAQGGGTALLGLVKGPTAGLPVEGAEGARRLHVVVCAQAKDESGKVAAVADQEVEAVVGADGDFIASFRLGLKPGKYTLQAGALEPKTGKGSVAEAPVEVPDFSSGSLAATLFLVDNVEESQNPDPTDAYYAFTLGQARIVPHFGSTYTKSQSMWFFYQYYDARADEGGKTKVDVAATIYRGIAPLAKAQDQTFDSVIGGTVIGPIDLKSYLPGKYKVGVQIHDTMATKELTEELPFQLVK